jgi:hypothetical protein
MSKRKEHHIYIHDDRDRKCCTICGKPYDGPGADHASCVINEGPTKMIESAGGWLNHLLGGKKDKK